MQNNESLLTLNNQQEQITQLSQEISSGLKLNSASDDPSAWAQAMNVKQGLREYTSCLSGISFATGWGDATESALNQLSDLVSQAKQLAISASSSTSTSASTADATQVDSILQEALNLANSQYGDQYIFSGTSTTTAPYSIDETTGDVTYSGDTNPISVKTGTSTAADGGTTVVNLTGDQVFSYTSPSDGSTQNVLNEIWELGNAITTGDTSTVSASITTLGDAFDHINNELTTAGCTLSNLTAQQSAIETFQTSDDSTLSDLQDADVAAATTQLSTAQTAFEAALKVTASLTSLNLAAYLTA
jgi:flagellar hook-associated protein 3 FlgL